MKVYILEDETNILKHILSLVQAIPYVQVVGYTGEIAIARNEIVALQPELILADIQLKDGNSFSLFNTLEINAQIVFITAYNQYAVDALNMGAFAYLLKPFDTAAFNETIDRSYRKVENYKYTRHQLEIAEHHYTHTPGPRRIALRSFDFTQIVTIEDIRYCQSNKGYTTFYLKDGSSIMVSKALKTYENTLPEELFIRCHQSYIVNINYISKYYKDGFLELTNGERILVSDRKRNEIAELIKKML